MRKLIIILLLVIPTITFGQKVFKTTTESKADYIIYIEKYNISDADWVIKKTTWESSAKNGIWYFVDWESTADIKIFITTDKYKADKIIYYTEWSTNIKFKLCRLKNNQ